MKHFLAVLTAIFVLSSGLIKAQLTEFHPELNWLTIKGKHVVVHYHEETERTARTVLKIADEVWDPITSLYEYEPETVHFVIKDIDDYSNGATYFFDNKIEIWSSALDTDLRGTHNWLRNVISHEFTHMVQTQASLKSKRSLPAVYLQFLNYEDKRRPDILYGFPNVVATYPVATINIPHWFSEGTAQYMRKEFRYDYWDAHRDMILREYALNDKMLTWNQMGVFEKTSLGNESVYNSGFALVSYIAQKYGEDKLRKISQALGKTTNFTMDAAMKDVLGKSGREVYDEWKSYITADYKNRISEVVSNNIKGEEIRGEGFGNFYPVLSSDGSKLIYVSNKNADYFMLSGIYSYDLITKKENLLVPAVRSAVGVIRGTNKIVYAKLSEDNPGWANIHDLYLYDIDKSKEIRLTYGLRANQPGVSEDGRKIVFTYQKDGTANIGLIELNETPEENKITSFTNLTFFSKGEQIFSPRFYNNDSSVVFDLSTHDSRDIATVNTDASGYKMLLSTKNDERNPLFSNGMLYYSSDESGIFNIYSLNPATGEKLQLTNVTGGAFMPSVDDSGNIAYAGYTVTGYKIFRISRDEQKKVDPFRRYRIIENPPLSADIKNGDFDNYDRSSFTNFDDSQLPQVKSEKYGGAFTKLTFYPFIRLDNYSTSNNLLDKIKPGVFLTSTDMLDRFSIFAGGSINKRMERDLFLTVEYRNKLPLLFGLGIKPELALELYSVSRKANTELLMGADTVGQTINYDYRIPIDVTYNLFEADLVAKHRIFSRGNDLEFRFIFSRYVSTIGSFTFPDENQTLYQSTNDTYLIGRNFQLTYKHEQLLPYVDDDISPIGRTFTLQYNYEMNKFNPDNNYENADGVLKPIYKNFNFHRVELNYTERVPLWKGHTVSAQFRAASILGPDVPDFFDYYLGGLIGMKSYPFYAISGNEMGWLNITYRFPLFRNIDKQMGFLYLDKIFMSVYGDLGNAWNGKTPQLDDFKKGAGAEIRVKMNSYYLFPTSVFFNAAYSFDRADRKVRNELIRYGKEWQFYGGVMFDFSF
ncbi:MAG: biopolymer transporter Tol [Bacteroidota bacterium]